MKRIYFSYSAIMVMVFALFWGIAPQKIYAKEMINHEIGAGNSVSVTSSTTTTIRLYGYYLAYAKYDSNGKAISFDYTYDSNGYSISIAKGQKIIISNFARDYDGTIQADDSVDVSWTFKSALEWKWLAPGESMTATNTSTSTQNIYVNGNHDYADYKSGIVYGCQASRGSGSLSIPKGESTVVTNSSSSGYFVSGPPPGVVTFANRSTPAMFHWKLQPDKTVQMTNKTGNNFTIYSDRVYHEHALYDSQNKVKTYGIDADGSESVPAFNRLVFTNRGEGTMEIVGPYDAFTVSSRELPALFTKTLKDGDSVRVTNPATQSHTLRFEGSYDFAKYNKAGEVEGYGKDARSSSSTLSTGSTIVVTKTGSGTAKVIGLYDTFQFKDSPTPALYTKPIAPGQSLNVSNKTTGTVNINLSGTFDYAYYDNFNAIQSYYANRTLSSLSVTKAMPLAFTNVGAGSASIYAPYDAFTFSPRSNPVSFRKTLAPNETIQADNVTSRSFPITVNGPHHYAIYDGTKVSKYDRPSKAEIYSIAASEKIVTTNSGAANLTVSGPYDAFKVNGRTNPALYKASLSEGKSLRISSLSSATFYLDIAGTYDQANYMANGDLRSFDRKSTRTDFSLYKGERVTVTGASSSPVQLFAPFDVTQVETSSTPALALKILTPLKSAEFTNVSPRTENIRLTGRYDSMEYDSSGNPYSYGRGNYPSDRGVSTGIRVAIENRDTTSMEVYGAYEVFRAADRSNPVTFQKVLAPTKSMEATNKSNKSFDVYYSKGLHDDAQYDKVGEVREINRDSSSTGNGIPTGNRLAITNTNTNGATLTVEGAYDIFTVADRVNPALFKHSLAPGKSMEAQFTGSTYASVLITGDHDEALYNKAGELQTYEHQNRSTGRTLRTGEKIAVQNKDASAIIVYGAYDVFKAADRSNPVTFQKVLAPTKSMEATNKSNKSFTLYYSKGLHDDAQYDKAGEVREINRDNSSAGNGIPAGDRLAITNTNTNGATLTVEGAYDIFTVADRVNPALFKHSLAPGKSMEAQFTGSTYASVLITGDHDEALYNKAGELQTYEHQNRSTGRTLRIGEKIAVQNKDASTIVVYGAYDVFKAVDRSNPVTFQKVLAPTKSMEATNKSNKGFTIYYSKGLHDDAQYDKVGEVREINRDSSSMGNGIPAGDRLAITNTNGTTLTVEGAYDMFTVADRVNPALFKHSLAPGKSMEAQFTGSTYASVLITGDHDEALYNKAGELQTYEHQNRSTGRTLRTGEKIAVQNKDASAIVVYGAYDVFGVQARTNPVTFVYKLTADQTIEMNRTLPKLLSVYLNGMYDYAQYDSTGRVREFNFNSNTSGQSLPKGDKFVLSPTQGQTVTVEGAYDGGFEITNRNQRAVTIRTLQPAASYSFQNISPASFGARINGSHNYQIFNESGEVKQSGSGSSTSRSVGASERLVTTNTSAAAITVAVPTDAIRETDNPDTFTKRLASGESMEVKNISNALRTLTVNGKYDFALYNAAGEPVSYERETSLATLSVPSGHRVVLTGRQAAGTTVSGSISAFTRKDQTYPALVQTKVGKEGILKATNLKNTSQTIKVEGTFIYRVDGGAEQVGQSPLTVSAGKTVWIRNTSGNEYAVYSPYDFFRFEGGGKGEGAGTISGSGAVDNVRKLDPANYDPQSFHADPIDTSTGAQIVNRTLLTAHGVVPVPFQAQYHSLLTGEGTLGTGWSHNYEMRLKPDSNGDTVTMFWNAFRANTFKRGADGLFVSDDDATKRDRLTKRPDGTFVLERNDGTTYNFAATGQLTQLQDKTGLKLVFGYSSEGKLTNITEPLTGAALALSYNAGHVAKVEDQAHRSVSFAYDTAGRMTGITDAAGQVTAYTYDANNRIVTATSAGVQLFKNVYDSQGRIVEQQDAVASNAPTRLAYTEADGQLVTTITDRNGNTQKRTHDAKYRLVSVEDALGRKTIYTYDNQGNRTSITNALNQTVTYSYDAHGNLTSATDHTGQRMSMTYDANNNLLTATGPDGNTIRNTYDNQNRLVTVADPGSGTTTYRYDGNGLLVSAQDPLGGDTLYGYTGNRLTSMKNATGETIAFSYDDAGRLAQESYAGRSAPMITKRMYNADDQLVSETNALGYTTTYAYDTQGFMIRKTDVRGNTTGYTYDGNGNVTQITNALNETTKLAYDGEGRVTSVTDPLGNRTVYKYDAAGNLVAETNAAGETVRYAYDALDRLVEAYGATGEKVYAVTYDAAGNPVTQTDALNHTWTNAFDQLNRLKQTTDPLQRTTSLRYDSLNRLTAVTDPLQGQASRSFDKLSQITGVIDPNGNTTSYMYDRVGRLTGETDATGGSRGYQYNSIGQLSQEKNGRNQTTAYQYDNAGRLTQFTDPAGTVTYTYDASGNVTAVTDGNGKTLTRVFDKLNRVEKYTDELGNTIQYAYDAGGNLKTLTYPDGKTVTYTYDAVGRMKTVTDWKNRVVTYGYDGNGRLISTQRPNGTVETRTYDANGQLLSLTDKRADGSIIHASTYTYDAVGNVLTEDGGLSVAQAKMSNIDATTFTTTDTLTINGPGLSPNPVPVADRSVPSAAGSQSVADATMTYTADNRLATYNGQTASYDADGNLIQGPLNDTMQAYTYDARNRLIEAGGVRYGYNSENIRTSVTTADGVTNYVVNPHAILSQVLMETNAQNQGQAWYVYGLGLIGREDANGQYRTYHYDRRGSTVALTDETGQVTDTYAYGSYGEAWNHQGETKQPFQYNGRDGVMTDPNGLYYMRARYYNPEIKRFVNRDVVTGTIGNAQTMNRYAYVNGNPISYVDPFGLSRDGDSKWIQGGDFLADLTPYVGTLKGFQQAFTGYNMITGQQLSTADRWSEGIGSTMSLIPIPGMKQVGKYGTESVFWAGKNIGNWIGLGTRGANRTGSLRMDLQFFASQGTGEPKKLLWGTWDDYQKVNVAGRDYAKIGDRLYLHHAVDRMQPSGMRYSSQKDGKVPASRILQAGQKDYGRSISPTFVEEVLTNGNLTEKQVVNGIEREVWSSGTIEVVTEQNGKIIITVMTK